jgi:CopG antitoxin of type II toxin-antitoxin system
MKKNKDTISAEELDRRFDEGEDIGRYLDWSTARRPGFEQRRVNVDLPQWMIESLDSEAKRVGVTRQSIVKVWLAERLKAEQGGGMSATVLGASH